MPKKNQNVITVDSNPGHVVMRAVKSQRLTNASLTQKGKCEWILECDQVPYKRFTCNVDKVATIIMGWRWEDGKLKY